MSKAQHTPGPWAFGDIEPQYNAGADAWQMAIIQKDVGSPESGRTIPAFAFGDTREQCVANARLIAMSPEMAADYDKLKEAYVQEKNLLGELLAFIHEDGGHYQETHGSVKAKEDAVTKFYSLRQQVADFDRLKWGRKSAE